MRPTIRYAAALLTAALFGCGSEPSGEPMTAAEPPQPVAGPVAVAQDPAPAAEPVADPETTSVGPADVQANTDEPIAESGPIVQSAAYSTSAPPEPDLPAGEALPVDASVAPEMPVVGPEGAVRMSYDDIDLFRLLGLDPVPPDVGEKLPAWMNELDGTRVRLRGFMFPPFAATGLRGFVLARDNEICCFGRDPKAYDIIPVEMREGVTTDYIEGRPFDVAGTFHVEPEADDAGLYQLFYITDAVVLAD